MDESQRREYWRTNLRLMAVLLAVWFVVSYLFGILLVQPLNNIVINGFPLGFWFAQQGSIVTFVVLIGIYVWRMDRLDECRVVHLDGGPDLVPRLRRLGLPHGLDRWLRAAGTAACAVPAQVREVHSPRLRGRPVLGDGARG